MLNWTTIGRLTHATCTWQMPNDDNTIYLTFDDGPDEEVTPWVLKQLAKHNALATFFLIGDNVLQAPQVVRNILSHKHAIGNHTQHHSNGWKTKTGDYLNEVALCNESLKPYVKTKIFRPPYGKLTPAQLRAIRQQYKVIMWSALAYDWKQSADSFVLFKKLKVQIIPGNILVFHDSKKAFAQLKKLLPLVLHEITKKKLKTGLLHAD